MRQGDAVRVGRLMNASHVSLRDDFEVSMRRSWTSWSTAPRPQPGCFGARMTGAGFGGCAVALVAPGAAPAFAASVATHYQALADLTPQIYLCTASAGAEVFTP